MSTDVFGLLSFHRDIVSGTDRVPFHVGAVKAIVFPAHPPYRQGAVQLM